MTYDQYLNGGYANQPYNGYFNRPTTPVQPPMIRNIIISIQGINAAKAYPLEPNTKGYFLDTDADYIYIKEIGADGMQTRPIQVLKCTEVSEDSLYSKKEEPQALPGNVITTDNLNAHIEKYLNEHSYKPYIPKVKK